MEYFKLCNREEYRFESGDAGRIEQISIRFQRHNFNTLNKQALVRGIYLMLSPMEIINGSPRFIAFTGAKVLLEPAKSVDSVRLRQIAEWADPLVPQIVELVKARQSQQAAEWVHSQFANQEPSSQAAMSSCSD